MWDYLEKFYLLPFKICENLSKYAKTFQNMRKHFKISENISKYAKKRTLNFKHYSYSH